MRERPAGNGLLPLGLACGRPVLWSRDWSIAAVIRCSRALPRLLKPRVRRAVSIASIGAPGVDHFDLGLNLKTVKALGLTAPP